MKQLKYLNVSNARFSGSVPSNLRNLTDLRVLDLSSNDQGPLWALTAGNMQWIANLTSLLHLGMSGIYLHGEAQNLFQVLNMLSSLLSLHLSECGLENSNLPRYLINSTLYSVRFLDLSQNTLAGSIPVMLQNMTSLRTLDLSNNLFSSSLIQNNFANFKNLVHLSLASNAFSSIEKGLLLILGNLCHLRSLDLSRDLSSNQYFQGEQIGNFQNLSGCFGNDLETLSLDHGSISGHIPDWLGMLNNLKHLHLSSNQLNGTIPDNLWQLSDLRTLDLSYNSLEGAIPQSLGQLSDLETLDLSYNSLEGAISEVHFARLSKLKMLSISSNGLAIKIKSNWAPPFQLERIEMDSCKFGTEFPQWLGMQVKATTLVLSNTSIKGTLPKLPSKLKHVDLSHNRMSGVLPEIIGDNLPQLRYLILSDNLITGSIPNSLCHINTLIVLELSKNTLSGNIPDCWRAQGIEALDLSSNNLSGVIPSSIGDLYSLKWLDLSNNNLNGELTLALKSCSGLKFLDLGENALSGNIPKWLGDSLLLLKVLRLRENKFNGSIPSQLCQLSNLEILDLAENKLRGRIPRCFGNLTGMVHYDTDNSVVLETIEYWAWSDSEHVAEVMKGRFLQYTSTILLLLVNLDLSRNKLEGQIPEELTYLTGLIGLNLSHNQLSGMIPQKIGQLEMLESLDLSVNELAGMIPSSMSLLTKLSHLNLSHNNLSGQIPNGNQLQTLDDPSIYAGNPLLCGDLPLKKCLDDEAPNQGNNSDNDKNNLPSEKMMFYIVVMSGFATGFWGVVGVLIFKKTWRHAYFLFVDRMKDRVLLLVALKMASVKNMIKGTA